MPRRVRAGLAALVLVAGAPATAAASGPTTTDPAAHKTQVDRQRSQLAERYDETLTVQADLTAAYEQSRATAAELTRKLATLDDYSAAVQKDLDAATATANRALQRRDAFREDLDGRERRAGPPAGRAARRPRCPATCGSASGGACTVPTARG